MLVSSRLAISDYSALSITKYFILVFGQHIMCIVC